jgi:hypothetical protein
MGSHGGGTPQGQLKIAEKFGVTEQTVGAPIEAAMDVVSLGKTPSGIPVFTDRNAYESDGIIVVHRIKPHRHLMGPHQSGFLKMLAIGLGKLNGAATIHAFGWENFHLNIPEAASVVIEHSPVILGLAIVENAFARTAIIEPVEPRDFIERDAALLQVALTMLPRIPFDKIDVLAVTEMGKNLPPDTDVTGRPTLKHYTEVVKPNPTRTVILDLHDDSLGNAIGMGSFDYTTRRFFDKIDFKITAVNSVAGNCPEVGMMPLPLDTDRQAIESALRNAGFPDVEGIRDIEEAKLVVIKNTREMQVMHVSQCLVQEIKEPDRVRVVGQHFELPFDGDGRLRLNFE